MTKIIFAALTALFLLGCGGGNDTETKIAYNKELGKTKDFKEKLDIGLKYCDKGLPKACEDAAEILGDGPATLKDPVKALKITQKACDQGSGKFCIIVAGALMMPNDKKNAEMLEAMTKAGLDYDIEKAEVKCATRSPALRFTPKPALFMIKIFIALPCSLIS